MTYAAFSIEDKKNIENNQDAIDAKKTANVYFLEILRQLSIICCYCQKKFLFNNKLYCYVRVYRKFTIETINAYYEEYLDKILTLSATIIEFVVLSTTQSKYGFRF